MSDERVRPHRGHIPQDLDFDEMDGNEAERHTVAINQNRRKEIENRYDRRIEKAHSDYMNTEEYLKEWGVQYADLDQNPALVQHVINEMTIKMHEAARNGVPFDMRKTMPEIGEKVRREAGLPTSGEKFREASLSELRDGRVRSGSQ